MVGESYVMAQLREQIAMAAPTNGRVLIFGENGTGKELVARSDPRAEPAPRRAVRRGQLRGDSRGADRERAVRPRARARSPAPWPDRRGKFEARRRRHALPRRDRRHEPEDAGQGAARAAGAGRRAGRRHAAACGRRARARGDEQGSAAEIRAGAVPRGPLLPPQRHPDLRAAAARPRQTTSRCWPSTSWRSSRASTAGGRSALDAERDGRAAAATAGRATCASCATSIERLMIMVPGDVIARRRPGLPRRRRA